MSGHNKWSTIKHRKGAQDLKRAKRFTKIIKEITVAAKLGGGDPGGNPRLRRAVDEARSNNMPQDNIVRAIKKGTGELEGVIYEELLYEGVGPAGVFVMVEVLTDNRNRTAAEIRKIFDKGHGQLGANGSSAWAFDQKGVIRIAQDAGTEDQLFEIAGEAGAEDLKSEGETWCILTARNDLDTVREAVSKAGVPIIQSRLEQLAKNSKTVGDTDGEQLVQLLSQLDDHDDVQNVFSEFEPSEDLLASLSEK